MSQSPLTLSAEDRGRVEEIQRLTQSGVAGISSLVDRLGDRSWAVRRAVIAALARLGMAAAPSLCRMLQTDRADEARIAATVDTLVQSAGDVDPIVATLAESTTSPAVVCDALQILGRRKAVGFIPLLARLSAHDDDNVAVAAIEALGRIGGTTAIEPLIAAVRTRNFFRTFPAVEVLGSSGDPRVIAPLAELLTEPVYATEAASALGRTAQLAAVLPLTALLSSEAPGAFGTAVRALRDLRDGYAARFGDVTPLVNAFRGKLPADKAAERLLAALPGADDDAAAAIACVLGWVKEPRVIGKLVELLDASPRVASEAAAALRAIGPLAETELLSALRSGDSAQRSFLIPLVPPKKSSVSALVECLGDADGHVKAHAAEALGRIGDPSAVTALFGAIGDPDARVSQSAVAALQSLGSAETEQRALSAAASGDDRTRRAALRIISYFGYQSGLDVLLRATTDKNPQIRDAATQGLAFVDAPRALAGLVALADDSHDQTRAAAMRALGHMASSPAVIALLQRHLGDESAWVRYYACQALGRLGARECIADVARLTEDPAGQVRVAAVEATARLGGVEAHAALERAAASEDKDVERAALMGLGSMRRIEALPVLLRALSSADAATRLITLSALEPLQAPEVFDAFVSAMSDSDPSVRGAAMTLLERRSDPRVTHWLIEQLRDGSRREWALRALSTPADGRLEQILAALESADAVLAPLLVSALTRMQRADGSAAVVAALSFENVFARRAAASALVATATPLAREALAMASQADSDEEVRNISAALVR